MKSIRILALAGLALFAGLAISSCGKSEETTETPKVEYCADCGAAPHEGVDCVVLTDENKCAECGLIKESPGCADKCEAE